MSTPAAAAPPKKKATKSKPAEHPKYKDMITTAIQSLKERNGSSRQAISKYLKANYTVGDSVDVHIKTELKRLVASGDLVHTKGTGASGSFKVAKKAEPKKKAAAKGKPASTKKGAKKPAKSKAAKKPAASAKKPAAKKPAAKKAAKKPVKKPAKKKAAGRKSKK